MTLAISYQPARGRHSMHRKTLAGRIWTWLFGETIAKYEGATEETAVIDAVLIDDPLDARWHAAPGDHVQPVIGEWVEAQYHAEHGRPLEFQRGDMPEIDEFTTWFRAITVPVDTDDDEQLALPAGTRAAA